MSPAGAAVLKGRAHGETAAETDMCDGHRIIDLFAASLCRHLKHYKDIIFLYLTSYSKFTLMSYSCCCSCISGLPLIFPPLSQSSVKVSNDLVSSVTF